MLSKVDGKKYLFFENNGREQFKISKTKTDKIVNSLKKDLHHFNEMMKKLYEEDYELYHLIVDEYYFGSDWEEGINYTFTVMENDLSVLQEFLSEDDEIPNYEEVVTLEDFGYEKSHLDGCWQKVIEDNDEKEVVEEIWINPPIRRIRTIIWKNPEPGLKRSKEIKYRKLRIGKQLTNAIKNHS